MKDEATLTVIHLEDPSVRLDSALQKARDAQRIFARLTREEADDVLARVGWHIYDEQRAQALSASAVAQTGIGSASDARKKLRSRVLSTLRDMQGQPASGLVDVRPAEGVRVFAQPKGVIGFVCPSTAPVVAVVAHALAAIKTQNAALFCPHPAVIEVVRETVAELRHALQMAKIPADLMQVFAPSAPSDVQALSSRVDFVVATGGRSAVARALSAGTPGLGGGAGNAVALVDGTGDVELAAREIVAGKTYDYGASCSAESCALVDAEVSWAFVDALRRNGGHVLDPAKAIRVSDALWPAGGALNRTLVGRNADAIAEAAGIPIPSGTQVLVVRGLQDGGGLLGREKLCPVLALGEFQTFEAGIALAQELIARHGPGHSASLYSTSEMNRGYAAQTLQVSRLMINQSTALGNTGRDSNGMPPSVTLCCGSWGGSVTNDNITWRHLLNYTTESSPTVPVHFDETVLFGRHWRGA